VAEIVLSLNDIISTTIEQKKGPQRKFLFILLFNISGDDVEMSLMDDGGNDFLGIGSGGDVLASIL
ncbi:10616_t:CDS:2, partial [Entrophospora sp. SA101]